MNTMKHNIAAFLGTFDPITLGHIDLIKRSSHIFEKIIVGVSINDIKNPLFDISQRVEMIQQSCDHIENIEVAEFDGLAVDFLKQKNITILVRGVRSAIDLDHEMKMATMNQILDHNIETIFFPTKCDYQHISSSLVKEVARYKGDISMLVDSVVEVMLKEKFKDNK